MPSERFPCSWDISVLHWMFMSLLLSADFCTWCTAEVYLLYLHVNSQLPQNQVYHGQRLEVPVKIVMLSSTTSRSSALPVRCLSSLSRLDTCQPQPVMPGWLLFALTALCQRVPYCFSFPLKGVVSFLSVYSQFWNQETKSSNTVLAPRLFCKLLVLPIRHKM